MAENNDSTALVPAPGQTPAIVTSETASVAVAAREKAAVEARYLVAMGRPRNPDLARTRLMKRCEVPRFADLAEYSKPVGGGKKATGGSIRLMEEIARQWGNIDVQSTVVFDDDERRIIRVTATDLESNYPASIDVILEKTVERKQPRQGEEIVSQRQNSKGEVVFRIKADEDAFLVKQGANVAKARREMIRAIVPGDLVDEALEKCLATRKTEVKRDPTAARKRIADSFYLIGVLPNQLCEYLGKPSLEAVTEAELEVLRSIYTAIRDGETTWRDVEAETAEEKLNRTTAKIVQQTTATAGDLRERVKNSRTTSRTSDLPPEEVERQRRMDEEESRGERKE